MKIIHLGNVPPPVEFVSRYRVKVTHPGRWVLNHAIAQKRAGMDVEVVTQAHKATSDFVCDIEGVKVHFLRTYHPYRHFTFYAIDQFRMASYVEKLRPDIVHAHGTEAAYALAAIRTGLPFCVTAQGLFFQIMATMPHVDWNTRFLRVCEHLAWCRARYVIAKSDYVREGLLKRYPHLDITRIPNTYESDLDCILKSKTGRRLVFVGTISVHKGFHLIAQAMEDVFPRYPDIELHLCGNPPEGKAAGYAAEHIGQLRKLLGDNLVLHGTVPSRQLFACLDDCDVILAPSLEDMFGNQLVEGLMRGCYGIVGEGTALAENVGRFGNGCVVSREDPQTLAQAICEYLDHPATLQQREEARGRIRGYMSPEVVAAAHRRFYERILAEKPDV